MKILIFFSIAFSLYAAKLEKKCYSNGVIKLIYSKDNAGVPKSDGPRLVYTDKIATEHAKALQMTYALGHQKIHKSMDKILSGLGQMKSRGKHKNSIKSKLLKKAEQGHQITSLSVAKSLVTDGVGLELVLRNPGPKTFDTVIDKLAKAMRKGNIEIQEVVAHHGPQSMPYISTSQMYKILKSMEKTCDSCMNHGGRYEIKDSGYTAVHIVFKDVKSGIVSELQIKGEQMSRVSRLEHVIYDLKQGKGLPDNLKFPEFEKMARSYMRMTDGQRELYDQYIRSIYEQVRIMEISGSELEFPFYPSELDPYLNFENIKMVFQKYQSPEK